VNRYNKNSSIGMKKKKQAATPKMCLPRRPIATRSEGELVAATLPAGNSTHRPTLERLPKGRLGRQQQEASTPKMAAASRRKAPPSRSSQIRIGGGRIWRAMARAA